jgi:hypothetical protein
MKDLILYAAILLALFFFCLQSVFKEDLPICEDYSLLGEIYPGQCLTIGAPK